MMKSASLLQKQDSKQHERTLNCRSTSFSKTKAATSKAKARAMGDSSNTVFAYAAMNPLKGSYVT